MFKKSIKIIYRKIIYFIFFIIYSKIQIASKNNKLINSLYIIKKIKLNKKIYNIFKIVNGRIYTNTIDHTAYICDNQLLSSPSFQYKNSKNTNIKNNIVLKIGTPRLLRKIKGSVFSLLSGGAANHNYGHWLTDVLPRIFLLGKFYSLKKVNFFLLPNYKFSFQKDTLEILGIRKNKIINSQNNHHIQADEIYATSHPCEHDPEKITNWNIQFLRDIFLKKINLKNKYNYERIYLDRGEYSLLNIKNIKNYRIILNEQKVKNYLKSLNFKIIKPQDLQFIDQVNLFYNAKCIVSLYGAGLSNILFCKANTKVIEIKTIKSGNEFKKISDLCKLQHYQISLKPILKSVIPQNGLINCPIFKIEKALKFLKIL